MSAGEVSGQNPVVEEGLAQLTVLEAAIQDREHVRGPVVGERAAHLEP